MIARYGVDRFRYFLMREVSFGLDGDFSEKALVERSNSDLSDNFGNMVHRTLNMVLKYRHGVVRKPAFYEDQGWETLLRGVKEKFFFSMERFAFAQALENVWHLVHFANRYIDQKAPWRMAKEENRDLDQVLYRLLDCSRMLTIFLFPFIPSTALKLWELLGMKANFGVYSRMEELEWGKGPECYEVKPPEPLFPRLL